MESGSSMYCQQSQKMYDNVSDMVLHREYFTTVCLSQLCVEKTEVLLMFVREKWMFKPSDIKCSFVS